MDLPPQKTNQPDAPKSSRRTGAQWALTAEAFAKLLQAFSPDEEEAGRLYLSTHLKLTRFFEWRTCCDPEHLVDITLNRIARKLLQGQHIDNVFSYAWTVADFVSKEDFKRQKRLSVNLEDVELIAPEPSPEDETGDTRRKFLDECLKELEPESRALLRDYHQPETKAKDARRSLAARLGIAQNALRIRAYRIRAKLEQCVQKRMAAVARREMKSTISHVL